MNTAAKGNPTMRKTFSLGLLALAAATAAPALAQSSDLATWTALGDVSADGLHLSTASLESDGASVFGGNALLYTDLEPALGVFFPGDTYEGSAISTSFMATAGSSFTLNWSFNTVLAATYDASFADRVVVVIDGVQQVLATATGTAQSGSFSHTFTSTGSHSLAFAVLDVGDSTEVSALSLSGLAVTPAVPEPASIALMLAGLGLVGAAARRRG
jgi:hypothetical protein